MYMRENSNASRSPRAQGTPQAPHPLVCRSWEDSKDDACKARSRAARRSFIQALPLARGGLRPGRTLALAVAAARLLLLPGPPSPSSGKTLVTAGPIPTDGKPSGEDALVWTAGHRVPQRASWFMDLCVDMFPELIELTRKELQVPKSTLGKASRVPIVTSASPRVSGVDELDLGASVQGGRAMRRGCHHKDLLRVFQTLPTFETTGAVTVRGSSIHQAPVTSQTTSQDVNVLAPRRQLSRAQEKTAGNFKRISSPQCDGSLGFAIRPSFEKGQDPS
ncbi:hypothetical protein MJG53_017077 [Ovis ammon polii x Ovis aries]|uniref:Uncharacterized protein n=1 Tax=Ovis ammon polii x Ovis aries TaxID=2918886 RepID=A0ACB9UAK5_9CETA|nr:hypothetical protein MJG53_017077 [Ovis ammon polii x Ovis aries]